MYKKQLKLQKIICFLCVAASAVCFVYALGLLTDFYDSFYATMTNPADLTQTFVPGSIIYYDMQEFNRTLLHFGIGMLLVCVFLFLMNTHVRRRYYIGNYVAVAVYAISACSLSVYIHSNVAAYKEQFLTTVDFEKLKSFSELFKKEYSESTFWLDAHYFVAGLLILSAVLLVANLIWKIRLERAEAKLVSGEGSVTA